MSTRTVRDVRITHLNILPRADLTASPAGYVHVPHPRRRTEDAPTWGRDVQLPWRMAEALDAAHDEEEERDADDEHDEGRAGGIAWGRDARASRESG
jgi:hypothetical protein